MTRSVCLSVCPFRELPIANSEPIELRMVLNEGDRPVAGKSPWGGAGPPNSPKMVLNEGEDRKTLLRRGGPRRRCLVLEI